MLKNLRGKSYEKSPKKIKSALDSQRVAGRPNSPPPELLAANLKSTLPTCK
jgi:hypothetical protein